MKDSKLILPNKRKELFDKIIKIVKSYKIIVIEPKEIDEAVLSTDKNKNLNWLEAEKSAEIIKKLNPEKVILDCPSTNPKAYNDFVSGLLETKTQLVCEHKADAKYVIVGAASILAKVTRDGIIEEIKKKYGPVGSGYPSDPTTKEFIKHNFNRYPEIIRQSWATVKNLKKASAQSSLGNF